MKLFTRLFSTSILLLLVLNISQPLASAAPAGKTTINVYNWGMYIADGSDGAIDVNRAFTEATGIEVNYITFDSNETMYTRLKSGGTNYDVIIPSDYMIGRLIEEDMLAPLNFKNIPNYQYIDESFRHQAYDPANFYSVPYTWGTTGLIYNTKYVTEPVDSWDLMWNENYKGKTLMFDNPRDAFAISQLLLGQNLNTETDTDLKAAAEQLKKQKPVVQSYVMDQIFDSMVNEEAWIGAYYAGDYLTMVQENENLAFCFPKEGFNLFIDAMCIPKNAANKEAAEAYINFLCSPEISGKNMDYLGYSTPISAAKQYMDPAVAESEIAYPDKNTLARGQSFLNLSSKATVQMENLWLDVKTDSSATGGINPLLYVGIGVVALLVVVLIVVNVNKKKRMAARKNVGR